MEESTTYQAILKEGEAKGEARGRLEEARDFLVVVGTEHLGAPDSAVRYELRAIADLNRLHYLARHVNKVHSWEMLLAVE